LHPEGRPHTPSDGGRSVACEGRDIDRYGRIVAVCRAGSEDLNAWMVSEGWALAYRYYSLDYVSQEDRARAAGRGLWRGEFTPPWEWRAEPAARSAAPSSHTVATPPPSPSAECRIKGNISSKGERIYHTLGGHWYEQTRIDPGKGERWFCSEDEARSAGWRPSRR